MGRRGEGWEGRGPVSVPLPREYEGSAQSAQQAAKPPPLWFVCPVCFDLASLFSTCPCSLLDSPTVLLLPGSARRT
eukprot:1159916-Pelagomonas_calceolata.AAC.4